MYGQNSVLNKKQSDFTQFYCLKKKSSTTIHIVINYNKDIPHTQVPCSPDTLLHLAQHSCNNRKCHHTTDKKYKNNIQFLV